MICTSVSETKAPGYLTRLKGILIPLGNLSSEQFWTILVTVPE